MGMSPGEWLLTRQIREAIPEKIATYCEFVPADVATQYIDGAYAHVSLSNYRDGYADVSPHFVNLHRFALPDFKQFELIYYAGLRNGNWFLLKYPFFNGDGYYLTGAELTGYDDHSRAFLARVFKVQHEHADAFTSTDVEPLVPTALPGLYANRFSTERKSVWTLWNANYRTARGAVLTVPPCCPGPVTSTHGTSVLSRRKWTARRRVCNGRSVRGAWGALFSSSRRIGCSSLLHALPAAVRVRNLP